MAFCRTFHPTLAEYIVFSSASRIFIHILGHQISLSNYKMVQVTSAHFINDLQGFLISSFHNIGGDNSLNHYPQQHTDHTYFCYHNYLHTEWFFPYLNSIFVQVVPGDFFSAIERYVTSNMKVIFYYIRKILKIKLYVQQFFEHIFVFHLL